MKKFLLITCALCYIAAMFILLHGWIVGISMLILVLVIVGLLLFGLRPSQWRYQWWIVRDNSE
jgi:O-antigen ligase